MAQKLSFQKIYTDCKKEVEKHLTSMWIGETTTESQEDYTSQLKEIISDIFAPVKAMPLVECTNRYESLPKGSREAEEAEALVGGLWDKIQPEDPDKKYAPYTHQARAWKALQEDTDLGPKSIVVTTGTGSGKTECFMLPLVNDIIKRNAEAAQNPDGVQAIFLYPLNALMDDQKGRLEKLLADIDENEIRYAVYNSNLAEKDDDNQETKEKIKLASGEYVDENGETKYRFPHAVKTRQEMRKQPPQILITNPTMLEYILLRKTDNKLINSANLKWIVLDEAHTYSGAAGAELAMLLRRVMLAFGTTPSQVRFAASSATLGNADSETERKAMMKEFIASVTGTSQEQIEVIDGKQSGLDAPVTGEYAQYWHRLFKAAKDGSPYIRLEELVPEPATIENKLEVVDGMCAHAPADARIKMHYFFRVPNGGLFVKLTETIKDKGAFRIHAENEVSNLAANSAPMLELCRCRHCGEYITTARRNTDDNTYSAPVQTDSDMFDLEVPASRKEKNLVFNRSRGENIIPGNDNMAVAIEGNKIINRPGIADGQDWVTVANTDNRCPNCGIKLSTYRTEDIENDEDFVKISKFRIPADLVSRWLAPVLLNHLDEAEDRLHRGQQYISFADSRQGAARASLKQNQEIERQWVYSKVFHALNKRVLDQEENQKKKHKLYAELQEAGLKGDTDKIMEISGKINILKRDQNPYLTWNEIAGILKNDPFSDELLRHFAEKDTGTEELGEDGTVKPLVKNKYIHSIMVEYLGKRPLAAASPETMGLFTTVYPAIEGLRKEALPPELEEFNKLIQNEALKISADDWVDLLQIFLDYTVRSNQSVFLELHDGSNLDIFSCIRFANNKAGRRTVSKPEVSPISRSRITRLLAQLLIDDKAADDFNDAIKSFGTSIADVVDAMWRTLAHEDTGLIRYSTRFVAGKGYEKDREYTNKKGEKAYPWRLNVTDIAFKVFDKGALANTANTSGDKISKRLRTVNVAFKGYSPYLFRQSEPVKLETPLKEWTPYPYGPDAPENEIKEWAKENRKALWEYNLWGENGVFATRLLNAYHTPDFFLQAEHTGQIDKIVSRQLQEDFKDRKINIMACSTTMEMGVDLGSLELVMLHNVPPMPMNYKQRAGRSGRNDMVKSVAVTLCGSDSIGLRTLYDPLLNIINRLVKAPKVDLMSPQVIQRHANAFLIRETGVFDSGDNGGSLRQMLLEYYTNFKLIKNYKNVNIVTPEPEEKNIELAEWAAFEDATGSAWESFNSKLSKPLDPGVEEKFKELLRDTFYAGKQADVIANALTDNENCRVEFLRKIYPRWKHYKDYKDGSDKQKGFFQWRLYELLKENLISFWARNRFTPTANMPVNIVTFDLTSARQNSYDRSPSNPTYDLRCALSQYAPGKAVVRDGKVNIVRGVASRNDSGNMTFETIYHDNDQVSFIEADFENPVEWRVNKKPGLQIIRPTDFLPDVNEEASRITDQNQYSRVNAQLIGTSKWPEKTGEAHLFDLRSSKDLPGSDILYYNDGKGYGYCYCAVCGKLVAEHWVAKPDQASGLAPLPAELNNQFPAEPGKKPYHFKIDQLDGNGKPIVCPGSWDIWADHTNKEHLIHRNMVLADTLQTDFTEIRLKNYRNVNDEEFKKLLITLAILIRTTFTEFLGIDTDSVDFTITPNNHIVIFDTNQGGAGYSNQLAHYDVMNEVLKRAEKITALAIKEKSKEALLDHSTLRFSHYIDPELADNWIREELNIGTRVPENINECLGETVVETRMPAIRDLLSDSQDSEITLFFNSDYDAWNYGDTQHGWLGVNRLLVHTFRNVKICVLRNNNAPIPDIALATLKQFEALRFKVVSMENPYKDNGVYPLIKIGQRLIVTLSPECVALNQYWGSGTLYSTFANFDINANPIDLNGGNMEMAMFFLHSNRYKKIDVNDFPRIIEKNCEEIINKFVDYCAKNASNLEITYQDSHLKSVTGMVMTLKVIDWLVKKINKPFNLGFMLEKYQQSSGSTSVEGNIINDEKRDEKLSKILKNWQEQIALSATIKRPFSFDKENLTHWRVLRFVCGEMELQIYPDGGFANGWKINFNPREKLTQDNMDINTGFSISLKKDVKFDVVMQEKQELDD